MSVPARARPRSLAFGAAAAAFAALVAYVHVVRMVEPLGADQGLFACFARWAPEGWLPYRDMFDAKPPLFLYSYALTRLVPGDVAHAIWRLDTAWLVASLSVAFAIGARLWGRWAGLACAMLLFAGLWSPTWGAFWSRAQAEELLTLPMLGAAWLAWRAIDRPTLALGCGVLTGLCGLYKIPSTAIAGAWALAWLLSTSRAAAAKRIALFACGFAAPWLLAVAWFAAHGALGDLLFGIFVFPAHFAAGITPPWLDVIEDLTYALVTRASLPLAAGALGLYAMAERGAPELKWVAPWIGFTIAAIAVQRQLADYHFLLAMPALAVAGGYAAGDIARRLRSGDARARAIGLACLVSLGTLAAREAWTWKLGYRADALASSGRLSRDAYLRETQRGGYSTADEEEAARYVRDRTTPSDGILVWGLSPGLYALADRHPVTRFPFHKIVMTDAPLSRGLPGLDDRRTRFMDGLRADPPAYVLVGHGDANGFEPEDSQSELTRFPALRELVASGYRAETTIGHFTVYRREAPAR